MASLNSTGRCPYCDADAYIAGDTETRRPGQSVMRCSQCSKWSVRQRGTQFPLQQPLVKTSAPTTKTPN